MCIRIWLFVPVIVGFLLDLVLGDPRWLYHPVRLIGHLIMVTENIIRRFLSGSRKKERVGGMLLVVVVLGVSVAVTGAILYVAYAYSWKLGLLIESFICYQMLAAKSLKVESDKVYQALCNDGLDEGRRAVSMIVGRDTQSLTQEGVTKAAIETVAENTSDGVIAPLFYMAIGGALLGVAYKAVNTMDSMVGYKNEKYQYFGTVAAKLDDVVNYIPARISAWLMIAAAWLLGMDGRNAWRIYRRDRYNHKSPNSAQTESAMAGALNVQLAGDAWYFGILQNKQTIGDALKPVELADIRRSHKLMYGTAVLALVTFEAIKAVIVMLI